MLRALVVVVVAVLTVACSPPASTPRYVGSARCLECHEQEGKAWQTSHHHLAIQEPDESTVLGDFSQGKCFFRKGKEFWVRADGQEFRVRYVFGVYPLQQLLLEMPDGRLQAFGHAWDSRPKSEGGQRWFLLGPEEPGPLHWTSRHFNWNHMCADCHSTAVRKGFHADQGTYQTTFSELSVGCEACHGPGGNHPGAPLAVDLELAPGRFQARNPETGSPLPIDPGYARREVDVCGRCHSRRSQFRDEWTPGEPLLNAFEPALLEEGLYFADGQQHDEVFTYGSYTQSKMFRAGVTCSDCHDPHSARLRASGNDLCARCHQPERFDAPGHTHHPVGSPGARCIACHAPSRVYMGVDVRHDHSFGIPRPDLSLKHGTPNACSSCHERQGAAWAARAVESWFPTPRRPHFGATLWSARRGEPGSQSALDRLIGDPAQSAIVRATAVALLDVSAASARTLEAARKDFDPLVRHAAARRLHHFPPEVRGEALDEMLEDPVRAVRIQAAVGLAGLAVAPDRRDAREAALADYLAGLLRDADRPEAHVDRGLLLLALGRAAEAERAYRKALALDPSFAPAYLDLADLKRAQGQEDRAEELLRLGLARAPAENHPDLHYALGLAQVRTGRPDQAALSLEKAYRLRPGEASFGVAAALALERLSRRQEAVRILKEVERRQPYDRDVLGLLCSLLQPSQAEPYRRRLRRLEAR